MRAALLVFALAAAALAQPGPEKTKTSPPPAATAPTDASPRVITIRRQGSRPAPPKPAVFDYSFGLTFPPFPVIAIPRGERFTLANGLTVHLVENRRSPAVRGALMIRVGSVNDPLEKVGLAQLTARGLRQGGSRALPGSRFGEALELAGIAVSAEAGDLVTSVAFATPSEKLAEALKLLHGMVTSPAFEDDAFDGIRGNLRDSVSSRNYDPEAVAAREFRASLYGASSELGRRVEYEHLDNTGREDAAAFHESHYAPAASVLVMEGDFAAPQLKGEITALFSGWTMPQAKPAPYPKASLPNAPGLFFADKRDAQRSALVIGLAGPKVTDSSYAAWLAAAQILGGGPGSRLQQGIASKRQWEAVVSAQMTGGEIYPGALQIRVSCRPAYTTELLRFVLGEVENLRGGPPTESELREGSARMQTEIALRFQAMGSLLAESERTALIGLGADRVPALQRGLTALTPAAVHRAAQGWKATALTVTVVGSSTLFDTPLTGSGRTAVPLDLTIPDPPPITPRTDAESIARGQQWLERMQKAMGGVEKLQAVKDWESVAEGSLWLGATSMKFKETNRWLAPRTLRQEHELPFGRSVLFYNGEVGWLSRPAGLAQMSPTMIRQAEAELFQLLFTLATSNLLKGRTVCSLGANIVQITSDGGQGVRLYLDEQTVLPARVVYLTQDTGNRSVMVEQSLSEWREFDGIRMPARIIVKHNGRRFTDLTIRSIRFNSGIDALELGRRP